MDGTLRVSRTRGAVSGFLLILLGAWGGIIPFVGPYFGYAYTPDSAWTYTSGRLWLSILPGAVTLIGGAILLLSQVRPVAITGSLLAIAAGAWFAVGTVLSPWLIGSVSAGTPVGGTMSQALETIGFYTGLGVVVVLVAAFALGRLSLVGVRDARLAEARAGTPESAARPVAPDLETQDR